jgi:uncharacterized low-complexity protein
MRIITALAALTATAVLAWGPVAAADTPAAPSATPVKRPSLKVCNKQADGRSLTGPARAQFVKNCREGKSSATRADRPRP